MLPPFIIEKLREREATQKERGKQRRLELEIPVTPGPAHEESTEEEGRGVVEIPIWAN